MNARDIALNPDLIRGLGTIAAGYAKRERDKQFNELNQNYSTAIQEVKKKRGEAIDFDSLERAQRLGDEYMAKAAAIGDEAMNKAFRIQETQRRVVREGLQDAITESDFMTRRTELERKRRVDSSLDRIAGDPRYSEYDTLRRTMTADELQGRKGARLQELRNQLMQDFDPQREAALEAKSLFDTGVIPQRAAATEAGAGAARDYSLQVQRIMDVMTNNGAPINRTEAEAIYNDRRKLTDYLRRAGKKPEEIAQLVPQLGAQINKEMSSEAGKDRRAELNSVLRRDLAALATDYKVSESARQEMSDKGAQLSALLKDTKSTSQSITAKADEYAEWMYRNGLSDGEVRTVLTTVLNNTKLDPNFIKVWADNLEQNIDKIMGAAAIRSSANESRLTEPMRTTRSYDTVQPRMNDTLSSGKKPASRIMPK